MLITLLNAAAEKARTGKWPVAVKDLPVDIYAPATPVKYLLLEHGPRIYSVGPNGKDDGGELDHDKHLDDIRVGNEQ